MCSTPVGASLVENVKQKLAEIPSRSDVFAEFMVEWQFNNGGCVDFFLELTQRVGSELIVDTIGYFDLDETGRNLRAVDPSDIIVSNESDVRDVMLAVLQWAHERGVSTVAVRDVDNGGANLRRDLYSAQRTYLSGGTVCDLYEGSALCGKIGLVFHIGDRTVSDWVEYVLRK